MSGWGAFVDGTEDGSGTKQVGAGRSIGGDGVVQTVVPYSSEPCMGVIMLWKQSVHDKTPSFLANALRTLNGASCSSGSQNRATGYVNCNTRRVTRNCEPCTCQLATWQVLRQVGNHRCMITMCINAREPDPRGLVKVTKHCLVTGRFLFYFLFLFFNLVT